MPWTIEPFEWSIDGVFVNVDGDDFAAEFESCIDVFGAASRLDCIVEGVSVDKYSVSSASDKLVVRNL